MKFLQENLTANQAVWLGWLVIVMFLGATALGGYILGDKFTVPSFLIATVISVVMFVKAIKTYTVDRLAMIVLALSFYAAYMLSMGVARTVNDVVDVTTTMTFIVAGMLTVCSFYIWRNYVINAWKKEMFFP